MRSKIKAMNLNLQTMILDKSLHDCSISFFSNLCHSTQKWGQSSKYWIVIAPSLSNLWIWNLTVWNYPEVCTIAAFQIFRFLFSWPRNEAKGQTVLRVRMSVRPSIRLLTFLGFSLPYYWAGYFEIPLDFTGHWSAQSRRFSVFQFSVMSLRNSVRRALTFRISGKF